MGNSCSSKMLPLSVQSVAPCVVKSQSSSITSSQLNESDICDNFEFETFEAVEMTTDNNFDFIVFVYLLGPIGIIGIAINLCAFFALRSVYRRYVPAITALRALSVANVLLLIVAFFHRTLETIVRRTDLIGCYIGSYQRDFAITILHAAADMTHTIAVYCILLVTIDRYLIVYRPQISKVMCKPCTVHIFIGAIFLFPIVLYLPRFFDFDTNTLQNASLRHEILAEQNKTLIQRPVGPAVHVVSKGFLAYRLLDIAVQSMIPITVIAVLNGLLIKAIRNVRKTQRHYGHSAADGTANYSAQCNQGEGYEMVRLQPTIVVKTVNGNSKKSSIVSKSSHSMNSAFSQSRSKPSTEQHFKRHAEERSILLTLVLLVSIFIIFELPMLILALSRFLEILFSFRMFGEDRNMTLYKFSALAQLSENLQACSSFFLYCSSYASFRRTVRQYFCVCHCRVCFKSHSNGTQPSDFI